MKKNHTEAEYIIFQNSYIKIWYNTTFLKYIFDICFSRIKVFDELDVLSCERFTLF